MKVTGERFMPDYPGDWSPEHYHRYFLARELVEGKSICENGFRATTATITTII